MPQPKKAARFGGSPAHHSLILSNLATELFRHGRIRTTHAKAKTVQPLAERMITFAKRGDVHSRRQVLRVIRDKDVVHKLFATIGPAFTERNGGYTRVLKLDPRKGDAAPMALIELVEGAKVAEDDLGEAPTRRWSLRRRRGGTRSSGAATRELDRAAAADRGDDLEGVEELEEAEAADAVPAGRLSDDADEAEVDEDAPQVTAAEVEARLAAEEDDEESAAEEAADTDTDVEDDDAESADAESDEADDAAAESDEDDDTKA